MLDYIISLEKGENMTLYRAELSFTLSSIFTAKSKRLANIQSKLAQIKCVEVRGIEELIREKRIIFDVSDPSMTIEKLQKALPGSKVERHTFD
jgi:nitrate reductase NapAB chaperone NapD